MMSAEGVGMESLNVAANVKVIKWAPQNDVLGHASVRAFVSHGGNNSIYEAAYHAVPTVVMPCVADQGENAVKVLNTSFGNCHCAAFLLIFFCCLKGSIETCSQSCLTAPDDTYMHRLASKGSMHFSGLVDSARESNGHQVTLITLHFSMSCSE